MLTSKKAKGRKGSIIAIIKGTKSETVTENLLKINRKLRLNVKEITLDMAGSMKLIAKKCFPNATQVVDRFTHSFFYFFKGIRDTLRLVHVQKLATEALQEIRIQHRWEAIELENNLLAEAKIKKQKPEIEIFENGDTRKQLLARSRYLLYKSREKWTLSQKDRAEILFSNIQI